MTRKTETECIFCDRTKFPVPFQVVSDLPIYWLFVLNLKPQTDFHSLVVLKPHVIQGIPHVTEFDDEKLPDDAVKELGMVIKQACAEFGGHNTHYCNRPVRNWYYVPRLLPITPQQVIAGQNNNLSSLKRRRLPWGVEAFMARQLVRRGYNNGITRCTSKYWARFSGPKQLPRVVVFVNFEG